MITKLICYHLLVVFGGTVILAPYPPGGASNRDITTGLHPVVSAAVTEAPGAQVIPGSVSHGRAHRERRASPDTRWFASLLAFCRFFSQILYFT